MTEKSNGKFNLKDRLASFRYAFNGFRHLFTHEHNARIHLFITCLVVAAGFLLGIGNSDWIAVTFAVGLVFMAELFNSALEYFMDLISPGYDFRVEKVKDLAAAAVLVAAVTSAVIGIMVFLPHVLLLLKG